MASAVDSRLAYARLSAVATASRLPTANRGSNNSYTTSWDTTDLSVSDTGIGIAKEDIATAVAHFGQVDGSLSRRYMGTGLGLPLVAWLAKLHGADMRIDSEVGLGTTVTVSFPCERLRPASPDKTLPGTWPIATAVV